MSVKMWAIKEPSGQIVTGSVHHSRKKTIADFVGGVHLPVRWDDYRKMGYRCVRVTVTVEAPAHE